MYEVDLKIEIRPIPNRNGIRDFSKTLEYFAQPHIISPLVNPVTLSYVTGLSKEDIAYLKKQKFSYEFEDTRYVRGVAHEFWESQLIKTTLKNTPDFLYPGANLIDFIKYKYLLKHDFIYSSEQEMLEGGKPNATHYIYNEATEVEVKASKISVKNTLLNKIAELSTERKREILLVLLDEVMENKSENYLTVKIEGVLEDKELSNKLVAIIDKDAESVKAEAIVKMAIQKGKIVRKKTGLYFFDANLGVSVEDVAKTLLDKGNQDMYLTILDSVQNN